MIRYLDFQVHKWGRKFNYKIMPKFCHPFSVLRIQKFYCESGFPLGVCLIWIGIWTHGIVQVHMLSFIFLWFIPGVGAGVAVSYRRRLRL
jgi:hypothetical protein